MTYLQVKKLKKDRGVFGFYVQVSPTRGLKVLSKGYGSLSALKQSQTYTQAALEAKHLRQAQRSGVVPRCFGLQVVKYGRRFQVAIKMSHLGTNNLWDADVSDWKFNKIQRSLSQALKQVGLKHEDLHEGNIMFWQGKYFAIDFTPERIVTIAK